MSIHEIQRQIGEAEEDLRRLKDRLWQKQLHLKEAQDPSDPEQLVQGYPWPGSRITKGDMIRLTELRRMTRKPITKLLHEAVTALYRAIAGNTNLKIVPCHGEGRSVWYVVDAHAPTDDQPSVIATASTLADAQAILRTLTNGHESSPGAQGKPGEDTHP